MMCVQSVPCFTHNEYLRPDILCQRSHNKKNDFTIRVGNHSITFMSKRCSNFKGSYIASLVTPSTICIDNQAINYQYATGQVLVLVVNCDYGLHYEKKIFEPEIKITGGYQLLLSHQSEHEYVSMHNKKKVIPCLHKLCLLTPGSSVEIVSLFRKKEVLYKAPGVFGEYCSYREFKFKT